MCFSVTKLSDSSLQDQHKFWLILKKSYWRKSYYLLKLHWRGTWLAQSVSLHPTQTTGCLLQQVTSILWRGLFFEACQGFKFYHISTIRKLPVPESLAGQKHDLSNELNSAHFFLNRWEIWLKFHHLIHQRGSRHVQRVNRKPLHYTPAIPYTQFENILICHSWLFSCELELHILIKIHTLNNTIEKQTVPQQM